MQQRFNSERSIGETPGKDSRDYALDLVEGAYRDVLDSRALLWVQWDVIAYSACRIVASYYMYLYP